MTRIVKAEVNMKMKSNMNPNVQEITHKTEKGEITLSFQNNVLSSIKIFDGTVITNTEVKDINAALAKVGMVIISAHQILDMSDSIKKATE